MFKKIIFAFSVIGIVAIQSCKDEPDPGPTPIVAPAVTIPTAINNVDGILAVTITTTREASTDLKVGTAHAVFYKGKSPANKLDAGSVKINSKTTTKSDDNIYFYTSSAAEPKGLEFQGQIFWQVSGSTSNDVPAMSSNDGSGFPNDPKLSEFLNLNVDQDKPLTWTSSFGADSVVLILKGPSATYKRVFNNTVTSHTVTKAEIAKLGLGSGSLQIINYKLEMKTFGTKSYAFLKQSIAICSKVTFAQ